MSFSDFFLQFSSSSRYGDARPITSRVDTSWPLFTTVPGDFVRSNEGEFNNY